MSESRNVNVGLLVLRIGIGAMFIWHGFPKLSGGPELWGKLGQAMGALGIGFAPAFWGFMAAFSECVGGVCLIIGLGFRVAAALLAITMFVAAAMHLNAGDGLKGAAHAVELCVVFISLIILGAGRYSLADKMPIKWLK